MKKIEQTGKVMGQSFFGKHKPELLKWMRLEWNQSPQPLIIFTPNPEHLVMTREKPAFARTLQQADLRLPDGAWIVIASRILSWVGKSEPIAERIPGVEFAVDLLSLAAEKKWPVVVVGGRDYEGKKVLSREPQSDGDTQWVIEKGDQSSSHQPSTIHWLEAYQDVTNPTVKEEIELKKQLTRLQPKLVLVALGAPWQEEWILSHYDILKNNKVMIAMVVGGAFDQLTGKIRRAPLLYRKYGFEWLYRLWQQPWRWRRQLRLVRFLGELCQEIFLPA